MSLELHEKASLEEAKQRAYRRGQEAYLEGMPCDAFKDKEILNYCKYFSINEVAEISLKWKKGWLYSAKYKTASEA